MTVAGQTSTLKRVGAGLAGQPTSQMNSPAARCKAGEESGTSLIDRNRLHMNRKWQF